MHKKSKRRSVAYIVSLLLTVFISIFIVLTISNFTVFNANYLLSKMESVNFYQEAISNLNEQIQQETQSTGFPIEMFENYIDEKTADDIIENHLRDALVYGKTKIDTSKFEEKLSNDIDNYLKSANIIINSEEETAISILKTNLIDYYETYLTFPYLNVYVDVVNNFHFFYHVIVVILVLLILLAGFILYHLFSHYRGRRRYFAYSLISSGLICFILPAIIYFGNFVNKISLSPQYFYNFITSAINTYLSIYIIAGLILIASGIICAYIKIEKS